MLTIDGYDIEFSAGESVQIEFDVEPIDLGDLTGNITGYFQITKKIPPLFGYCGGTKPKIIEFKTEQINGKFVLKLKSRDTKNLIGNYFWGLRLSNNIDSVFPIINERLKIRGLGRGACQSLPSAVKC